MFDSQIRPFVDRALNPVAKRMVHSGVTANQVTIFGAVVGGLAAGCVALQFFNLAFCFILLNRIADGLDGSVARYSKTTDFGGYLDIVSDFIFYSAVPFAFAIARPETALAAAFLIFSFIGTSTSFLGFAILAEKRRVSSKISGKKAFYYLGGLTEGTETILLLLALVVWPDYFIYMAFGFGLLCWCTTLSRIYMTFEKFGEKV